MPIPHIAARRRCRRFGAYRHGQHLSLALSARWTLEPPALSLGPYGSLADTHRVRYRRVRLAPVHLIPRGRRKPAKRQPLFAPALFAKVADVGRPPPMVLALPRGSRSDYVALLVMKRRMAHWAKRLQVRWVVVAPVPVFVVNVQFLRRAAKFARALEMRPRKLPRRPVPCDFRLRFFLRFRHATPVAKLAALEDIEVLHPSVDSLSDEEIRAL